MRRSAAAIGLAACVAAIGCGGGDGDRADRPPAKVTPAPTTAPQPLDQCPSAGRGWRPLPASAAIAAHLGSGSLGVVFVDDSTDDPCAWSKEARDLAAGGYAVAVFKEAAGPSARRPWPSPRRCGGPGARRIALIGASVGARAVLLAAATHPPGIVGVVSLSAERRVRGDANDLVPPARRVRLPVLSIGAREDALTRFGRDTRAFQRALRTIARCS